MRQGPNNNNNNNNNNNRRSRTRGGSNSNSNSNSNNAGNNTGRRPNVPLRHQTFDSNGPDVRIRGNAFQVHEKYLALARDAAASGDRIAAESYLQHAEHYFRIIGQINEAAGEGQRGGANRPNRPDGGPSGGNGNGNGNGHDDGDDDDDGDEAAVEGRGGLNA
jgi:hypothetical protein